MLSTTNAGTIQQSFQQNQIAITGATNKTKVLKFDVDSNVPNATTVNLKIPQSNGDLVVDTAGALAITNVPSTGQVLTATGASTATWQTATSGSNPPFNDNVALLQDSTDTSKKLIIDVQNVPNATTQTIRTPAMNSLDIMVVEGAVQTLNFKTLENAIINDATNDVAANKLKVAGQLASQAVSITNAPTTGQVLTAVTNFSASWQTPSSGGNPPFNDNAPILQDSADTTKRLAIDVVNIPTNVIRTLLIPANSVENDAFVLTTTQQSMTNKTLNAATNDVAANKLKTATGTPATAVTISNDPAAAGYKLITVSPTSANWVQETPDIRFSGGIVNSSIGGAGGSFFTLTSSFYNTAGTSFDYPRTRFTAPVNGIYNFAISISGEPAIANNYELYLYFQYPATYNNMVLLNNCPQNNNLAFGPRIVFNGSTGPIYLPAGQIFGIQYQGTGVNNANLIFTGALLRLV